MLRSQAFYSLLLGACTAQSLRYFLQTPPGSHETESFHSHRRQINPYHKHTIPPNRRTDDLPHVGDGDSAVKRQAPAPLPTVFSTTTIYTTITERVTSTVNTTIVDTVTITELGPGAATEYSTITSSLTALSSPPNRLLARTKGPSVPALSIPGQDASHARNNVLAREKRQVSTTVTSIITVIARTVVAASGTVLETNTLRSTSTVVVRPRATTTESVTTTVFIGIGGTTIPPTVRTTVIDQPGSETSTPAADPTRMASADLMARAMAGVAIGAAGIVLVLVLGLVFLYIRRRRRSTERSRDSTSSFGDYGTTAPMGDSKPTKPKPVGHLGFLRASVSPPTREIGSASSENGYRQDSSRRSTIRFVVNPPELLGGRISKQGKGYHTPAKKPSQESMETTATTESSSRGDGDHTFTESENTPRLILRPLGENTRRLEPVLAEQEEHLQPIMAPREWRSSAWPLPDEPLSRRPSRRRSSGSRLSRPSGFWAEGRYHHHHRQSSSPPDLRSLLLPSGSGRNSPPVGLQRQQQQQQDTTRTANGLKRISNSGYGENAEVSVLQWPSPLASSDVLGPAAVDSALSWRLSTEAELRRQSRAKMSWFSGSEGVVSAEEKEYSTNGNKEARLSSAGGGSQEWVMNVALVPTSPLRQSRQG